MVNEPEQDGQDSDRKHRYIQWLHVFRFHTIVAELVLSLRIASACVWRNGQKAYEHKARKKNQHAEDREHYWQIVSEISANFNLMFYSFNLF